MMANHFLKLTKDINFTLSHRFDKCCKPKAGLVQKEACLSTW
jgi:hypothetical protein